jgi:four helix bundle protein
MQKREKAQSFKDLIVWQKAHLMVLEIYKLTRAFPKDELYVLTSQLRRSSISVAANIAEAFKKKSAADKLRILNIAQGSLSETEYHVILSKDLQYTKDSSIDNRIAEVGRLLEKYMQAFSKNEGNHIVSSKF